MNIMLLGYGRAGKGTFCDVANKMGMTAISSSYMACKLGAFDALAEKHGFASSEAFYPNRHVDRQGCYEAICDMVAHDRAYLGEKIFEAYNIYDGCRDDQEFYAIRDAGLIDLTIWIEAGDRIPAESADSMKTHRGMADIVLFNDKDGEQAQAEYEARVRNLLTALVR